MTHKQCKASRVIDSEARWERWHEAGKRFKNAQAAIAWP